MCPDEPRRKIRRLVALLQAQLISVLILGEDKQIIDFSKTMYVFSFLPPTEQHVPADLK